MRLALVWAGIRRRIIWNRLLASLASSASKLARHECQMITATSDPGGDQENDPLQKNPSVATNKGRLPSPTLLLTPAPASTLFCCARSSSACLLQQRAGSKLLRQFTTKIATGSPTVKSAYPAEIPQRRDFHRVPKRGRLGGRCVAMTQSV